LLLALFKLIDCTSKLSNSVWYLVAVEKQELDDFIYKVWLDMGMRRGRKQGDWNDSSECFALVALARKH
jgi:hypothetical protein